MTDCRKCGEPVCVCGDRVSELHAIAEANGILLPHPGSKSWRPEMHQPKFSEALRAGQETL